LPLERGRRSRRGGRGDRHGHGEHGQQSCERTAHPAPIFRAVPPGVKAMGLPAPEDGPSGPCGAKPQVRYCLWPPVADPALMIDEEIRTLLEAPAAGDDAPTLAHVEDTLTSGYARAMAPEAERMRLEPRLAE